MKKNTKIAKQLLKIARMLVSDNARVAAGTDITDGMQGYLDQVQMLRAFPATPEGDEQIHNIINQKFKELFTIKNGTMAGWEQWKKNREDAVRTIIEKIKNGKLKNTTPQEIKKNIQQIQTALAFMANDKFLVSLTPGAFADNPLQQKPGETYEVNIPGEFDEDGNQKTETRQVPNVPGIKVDMETEQVEIDTKHPSNPSAARTLKQVPSKMMRMHDNLITIATSWGSRILGGTQLGTIDLGFQTDQGKRKNEKEIKNLTKSYTEISDTELNNARIRILAQLSSGNANAIFTEFQKIFMRLSDQLKYNVSEQSLEEFEKNQQQVIIAIQGENEKVDALFTTYRDGTRHILEEYGKMCAEVESAGGTVDDSGNIILPNGKQASIRTRKAGLFDKLKNIGSKIIDSVASICKKLFGAENEIRKELSNCNEKMQAWSMAGQEVNESYEDKIQAINDCLKELQNIGN